jgi:hypothetical protein
MVILHSKGSRSKTARQVPALEAHHVASIEIFIPYLKTFTMPSSKNMTVHKRVVAEVVGT